jgi:hypothetical protein
MTRPIHTPTAGPTLLLHKPTSEFTHVPLLHMFSCQDFEKVDRLLEIHETYARKVTAAEAALTKSLNALRQKGEVCPPTCHLPPM